MPGTVLGAGSRAESKAQNAPPWGSLVTGLGGQSAGEKQAKRKQANKGWSLSGGERGREEDGSVNMGVPTAEDEGPPSGVCERSRCERRQISFGGVPGSVEGWGVESSWEGGCVGPPLLPTPSLPSLPSPPCLASNRLRANSPMGRPPPPRSLGCDAGSTKSSSVTANGRRITASSVALFMALAALASAL